MNIRQLPALALRRSRRVAGYLADDRAQGDMAMNRHPLHALPLTALLLGGLLSAGAPVWAAQPAAKVPRPPRKAAKRKPPRNIPAPSPARPRR